MVPFDRSVVAVTIPGLTGAFRLRPVSAVGDVAAEESVACAFILETAGDGYAAVRERGGGEQGSQDGCDES